jgi:hypothetical protein
MDLNGSRPPEPVFDATGVAKNSKAHDSTTRTRLPKGGPPHGAPEKFDSIGGDTSDDWPFHAAASVMRAHSLLRSFSEVDAEHTAVTGISWGGYTTGLVASLDDRFKAAVPVYGCGFLHEGESVQKPSIDKLGDRKALQPHAQPRVLLPEHVPQRQPARRLPGGGAGAVVVGARRRSRGGRGARARAKDLLEPGQLLQGHAQAARPPAGRAPEGRADLILDLLLASLESGAAPSLAHVLLGFDASAPPADWRERLLLPRSEFSCLSVLLDVLQAR